MASPTSYKDPYWSQLASSAEAKNDLPSGLLVNVLTKGERTNADRVSSAGARTPFQIIPSTRKLLIDKYGIDPYLNDQNAADGAALLLKESLQRNKDSIPDAVAEYHGGTDRSNWGPVTRSYVQRVTGQGAGAPQGQSTFQRALEAQKQAEQPQFSISSIYDAYKNGKMSPQEASDFESDVKAGAIILPRGASLKGQPTPPQGTAAPEPIMLDQGITNAYITGQMTPQERADLESDIQAGLVKLPPSAESLIPDGGPRPAQQPILPTAKAPSLADRLIGTGEAALSTISGATTGALAGLTGTVEGIATTILNGTYGTPEGAQQAEQIAANRMEQYTYAPRTEQGQAQAQAIGEVLGNLAAIGPMAGELGQLGAGAKAAVPGATAAAERVVVPAAARTAETAKAAGQAVQRGAQSVVNAPARAAEAIGLRQPSEPVAAGSIGAAATPAELQRITQAESLPTPIELTRGAASREAGQLAFEKEQIKGPLGAPLRQRAEQNNIQALQNFESLIDATEAQTPDLTSTGSKVVDALSKGYKEAKVATRTAYKEAEKSGEMAAPVPTDNIVRVLNESASAESTAPVLSAAKKEIVRLGGASMDDAGNLIPSQQGMSLKDMEQLRSFINKSTGYEGPNLKFSGDLKRAIDDTTAGAGGEMYAKARAMRQQQARKYENRAIVAKLITNRRGMEDPKVAVDQVFRSSILNGSPDEITFLKRVLNTSGSDGQQAWKELQGATISNLRDEATKGMGLDSNNNPLVSPAKLHNAVQQLDKNGRLDIVLGKKNAEIVRNLNDVVRYVNTVPPGTLINNSGTAATLLAAIGEAGVSGALTGLPFPLISTLRAVGKSIENKRISAKINQALNAKPKTETAKGKF